MIITISGQIGAGKSTVARKVAEKLGLEAKIIGDVRRDIAKKRHITLEELNKLDEKSDYEHSSDKTVDEWQKRLGEREDNFLIEGRTSFYFIPQSLKIYLKIDERTGAERIWKEIQEDPKRRTEENFQSFQDILRKNKQRTRSDRARYAKFYNDLDIHDETHYDLVVDTTKLTITQVVGEIVQYVSSKQ